MICAIWGIYVFSISKTAALSALMAEEMVTNAYMEMMTDFRVTACGFLQGSSLFHCSWCIHLP